LIQLILLGFLALIVLYSLRGLWKGSSAEIQAKLRKPLLWLGLLALAVLASRLGWIVPLLGALTAAAIRYAPVLAALLPLLKRVRRADAGGGPGEAPRPPPNAGRMSRQEAYEILGLAPGASREDIISAHRRLMQKMHPDRGGSDYLAGKINQARETLLAR